MSLNPNPNQLMQDTKTIGRTTTLSEKIDSERAETKEIAAQLSLPQDEGGWGWVILFSSFWCLFILDGTVYSFGALLHDISNDLQVSVTLVALINSIKMALYYMLSPLASALINRLGFRKSIMTGAVICSFSQFASYFAKNYISLLVLYGILTGIGTSLIQMSAGLIVGFYFEKLRSLAMAIATCGSCAGISIMYPINSYLVNLGGWKPTILFHSGIFGIIFYLGMTYQPLVSVTVVKTEENGQPIHSVTLVPGSTTEVLESHKTHASNFVAGMERLFRAPVNRDFPTADAVIKEDTNILNSPEMPGSSNKPSTSQPSASAPKIISKITVTAHGSVSHRQLQQVSAVVSKSQATFNEDLKTEILEVTIVKTDIAEKSNCCARCCKWTPHVAEARPMYRDDAFYEGNIQNLPTYTKNMVEQPEQQRTGFEYQMAVTRTISLNDLEQVRGVFTTAMTRVFSTMMDITILRKRSFQLFCLSGFLVFLGVLVPYVYMEDRNKTAGVASIHCTYFISVIGLNNALGRLGLGLLALKIEVSKVYAFSVIIAGVSTMFSSLYFDLFYQYSYAVIFGFFISATGCLRSVMLVSLYGLDRLTNATGIMCMFFGLGSLGGTPLAGVLQQTYGYDIAFYVSGFLITIGGILVVPINSVALKEEQ